MSWNVNSIAKDNFQRIRLRPKKYIDFFPEDRPGEFFFLIHPAAALIFF